MPKKAMRSTQSTPRIKKAGMEAMTHFTMKVTIDQNGMRISVTTTCRWES
jgi:hypothetical protein